jgi:hypothetical protein
MNFLLFLAGVGAALVLAFQLWRSGLSRKYRWLYLFAFFSASRDVLLWQLGWGRANNRYAVGWLITEPISWIFYILLTLELFSLIFEKFPALASWGRRTVQIALAASVSVSVASVFLTSSGRLNSQVLEAVFLAQRVVLTGLILCILAILFSLTWLRLPLPRNTIFHSAVFFLFFLSKVGFGFVFRTLGLPVRDQINVTMAIVSSLCLAAWAFLLTRDGESMEMKVGHSWNPEQGERLIQQLESLNRSLARAGQRHAHTPSLREE